MLPQLIPIFSGKQDIHKHLTNNDPCEQRPYVSTRFVLA